MKKIILTLAIVALAACGTTQKFNATKNEQGDLIGIASKEDFEKEPYFTEWFNDYHSGYEADNATVTAINNHLEGVTIKAFMGTWCGDSQREVPTFYNIFDQTDFNYKNLELVTVDRNKKAKGLEKGYDIIKVPTFIFFKNGKELGRFVEHPVNEASLEHDILQIISGKNYKHAYQK